MYTRGAMSRVVNQIFCPPLLYRSMLRAPALMSVLDGMSHSVSCVCVIGRGVGAEVVVTAVGALAAVVVVGAAVAVVVAVVVVEGVDVAVIAVFVAVVAVFVTVDVVVVTVEVTGAV